MGNDPEPRRCVCELWVPHVGGSVVYRSPYLHRNVPPISVWASFPYLLILGLCLLCLRLNGKPWIVSFTDANLIATLGGLGVGMMLWFTSGADYEEGRAAIYACALTLMWGSIFYVIAYIFSVYLGTQERGNYQTKTWHLSEGDIFHLPPLCTNGCHRVEEEAQDKHNRKLTIRLRSFALSN